MPRTHQVFTGSNLHSVAVMSEINQLSSKGPGCSTQPRGGKFGGLVGACLAKILLKIITAHLFVLMWR